MSSAGEPSLLVKSEFHTALCPDARTTEEIWSRIAPKIRSVLPDVLAWMGMTVLGQRGIEVVIRVYLTGGFFEAHNDEVPYANFKLSFAYYFHRRPRRFSGGDLLLYDTDVDRNAYDSGAFSRITPLRNSIVFFPSTSWHQVTPVQCETDDLEDGRWVLNGHVWRGPWKRMRHGEAGRFLPVRS